MKVNESGGTQQRSFKFFRDLRLVHPPMDAPQKLVRQCVRTDKPRTTAMQVAIEAAGLKQLALAAQFGIGESYMSKLIAGTHNESGKYPDWFVDAFCWATRSRLLEQVMEYEEELADEECQHALIRRMAAQLPVAEYRRAA